MAVEPGDESRLEAASGWDSIWRMQFAVAVEDHDFVLEADVLDWGENCYLYRDGIQVAAASSPARFPLADHLPPPPDGAAPRNAVIEANIGWIGMRRAHLVDDHGERELVPLDGTWEHARAARRRRHRGLSLSITVLTLLIFVLAAAIELTQSLQWVTRGEWFASLTDWRFDAPWDLPLTVNIIITVVGVAALAVSALRLRRTWMATDT